MENPLVTQIFTNLPLDWLEVREHITVGDHNTSRLSRGARGKDNLKRVLAGELRRIIRDRRVPRDRFAKRYDCEHGCGDTSRGHPRANQQLGIYLLRNA